jgi:hypothetical protein
VVQNSQSQPTTGSPDGSTMQDAVVDPWASTYKLPFDVAADPNAVLQPYYSISTFPMQMVVRVSDMSIVYKHKGISTIAEMQAQIDALVQ